jgi:hypothetical protein
MPENKMEMSLESVRLIAEQMNYAAEFVKGKTANHFPNGVVCHVVLDGEFIIGEIRFTDDFIGNVSFFPNGDWFGTNVVGMG